MSKSITNEEARGFANMLALFDSFNAVANEMGIPIMNEIQKMACNYLEEDGLRYMNSLGYLLHVVSKEEPTNIHDYLKINPEFSGVIVHPEKFGYNEKPVCFGIYKGKIIYTKCSTCLTDVFDVRVNIGVIALYGYNRQALCLNYFYAGVFFSRVFFEIMAACKCLPISFNDLELLCYISVYCISTGRHDQVECGIDNYDCVLNILYDKTIKECIKDVSDLGLVILFSPYLVEIVGVYQNKMIGESELLDKKGDIIIMNLNGNGNVQYEEFMSRESIKKI